MAGFELLKRLRDVSGDEGIQELKRLPREHLDARLSAVVEGPELSWRQRREVRKIQKEFRRMFAMLDRQAVLSEVRFANSELEELGRPRMVTPPVYWTLHELQSTASSLQKAQKEAGKYRTFRDRELARERKRLARRRAIGSELERLSRYIPSNVRREVWAPGRGPLRASIGWNTTTRFRYRRG